MSILGSVYIHTKTARTYLICPNRKCKLFLNSCGKTRESEVGMIAYKITSTSGYFFLWVLAHFITAYAIFNTV